MEKPNVSLEDWIVIGNANAVVCNVFNDGPADLEVVILDKGTPTNFDVVWKNDRWDIIGSGGYAAKYSRLAKYVSILRSGHRRY
jgi:hypothetical protein